MRALVTVKAVQLLRNNRVQLQGQFIIDPLTTGHVQVQLPVGAAARLLGGVVELDRTFQVELETSPAQEEAC